MEIEIKVPNQIKVEQVDNHIKMKNKLVNNLLVNYMTVIYRKLWMKMINPRSHKKIKKKKLFLMAQLKNMNRLHCLCKLSLKQKK